MANSINFVSLTRRKLSLAQQRDRILFKQAAIASLVFLSILATVIGVRLWLAHSVGQLQTNQQRVRQSILSQQAVEEEYTIFAHKLRRISDLFGKRKDKQEALLFFSNIFGSRVIVSGIDYTSDRGDIVSFSVRIPSVFVLNDVFDKLDDPEVIEQYSAVSRNNLRRGADGSYNMSLTVSLADN